MTKCPWCGKPYETFNAHYERIHLSQCPVFQSLPVAEVKDGKEFVALTGYPYILVEREKAN